MAAIKRLELVVWAWGAPFPHAFPVDGFNRLLARKKQAAINTGVFDLLEWLKYRTLDGVVYEDTRVKPAGPPDMMCEIHVVPSSRKSVFLGLGYDARESPSGASATCYLMGLWCSSDDVRISDFVAAAKVELLTAN